MGIGFDTAFVFTEVNADVVVYVKDPASSWGFRKSDNFYHDGGCGDNLGGDGGDCGDNLGGDHGDGGGCGYHVRGSDDYVMNLVIS